MRRLVGKKKKQDVIKKDIMFWMLGTILLTSFPDVHSFKCEIYSLVCEVWLEVSETQTMTLGKSLVVARKGHLFRSDQPINASNSESIPIDQVISGDGWKEPRLVIAVNGSVPGPAIEVHEGQIVRVHVRNNMASQGTSMHFHGQYQRGTPWMDGVAFATQCPILPGHSFTYQFRAEPEGTHWYHAHLGSQLTMGQSGPFIVHPRQGQQVQFHKEFVMTLQDWNHDWDSTLSFMKMLHGIYLNGVKQTGSENLSGAKYSSFRFQSGLINGRGRYYDPETGRHNEAPLEHFDVKSGHKYLFRMIHGGSVYPFRVSIDKHPLTVVATDGRNISPVQADAVIVVPGERYDFEIYANQSIDNYWIRAVSLEVGVNHTAEAILHYHGASSELEPVTSAKNCTFERFYIVNCPFGVSPENSNTNCINIDSLVGMYTIPNEVGHGAKKVKEYFINFAFPGTSSTPASVNGVQFQAPPVSVLTQPLEFSTRCPGEGYRCQEDQLCHCTNVLDLQADEVVQIVMTNLGNGKGWDHPVHLHGHHFWVVKVGWPKYDIRTGKKIEDNLDINCRGNPNRNQSFCNNATWFDPTWTGTGNSVPGLKLTNPILKDTVNVPTGGYVVIRFKADNPGVWMFHCHVELHFSDGMVMMLNESYPFHPPPPPRFPECRSFDIDPPVVAGKKTNLNIFGPRR